MRNYNFCLAWNWGYDADFVALLAGACQDAGLSMLQITPENLEPAKAALLDGRLGFQALLDRASDADDGFLPLVEWARSRACFRINPFRLARRAWDKAWMHSRLTRAGQNTPHTIVLPSFAEQCDLPPVDLSLLGARLAIKPAHGGGGRGVVNEATSWEQVLSARQVYPDDQYLLQSHIAPVYLDGRQAWFRILYCAGEIYPCWWDTGSHIYSPVTLADEQAYALAPLLEIAASIASLSGLALFSTEVALAECGRFFVIDYVNDPVDLRLQSQASDGVPDTIVAAISQKLAGLVATQLAGASAQLVSPWTLPGLWPREFSLPGVPFVCAAQPP